MCGRKRIESTFSNTQTPNDLNLYTGITLFAVFYPASFRVPNICAVTIMPTFVLLPQCLQHTSLNTLTNTSRFATYKPRLIKGSRGMTTYQSTATTRVILPPHKFCSHPLLLEDIIPRNGILKPSNAAVTCATSCSTENPRILAT
jgi:hypothetical protein